MLALDIIHSLIFKTAFRKHLNEVLIVFQMLTVISVNINS